MSKKLLMGKTEEYKGPILYETKSVTDTQPTPSDSNYSMLEDEPVYFNSCYGSTVFNGYSEPFVLGDLNPDGTYTYTIKQTSVANPDISSMSTFVLDHQLCYYNSSCRDNLYWSDKDGCYIIVKNVEYAKFTGTTSDEQFGSYTSQLYGGGTLVGLPTNGYPNGDGTNQAIYNLPTVKSNWEVTDGNTAMNRRIYAVVGDSYATIEKLVVCLCNYTSSNEPTTDYLRTVFGSYPLYATFPSYHKYGLVTSAPQYATDITRKIKLKSYKGGTKYSMVDTGGRVREIYVDIPIMETKYVPRTEIFEGTSITLNDPNYIATDVYFEGLDSIQANVEYKIGDDAEYKLKGAYKEFDKLFDVVDDTFVYKIKTTSADGLLTEYTEIVLPDAMLHFSDSDWTGYDKDPANPFPHSYTRWSEEHQTYMCYTNNEFLYLDNIDTFKYGQFTKTTATQYLQWVERPAWKSPCLPHLHIVKPQNENSDDYEDNPWGGFANLDTCEPYYMGAYVQNPIMMIARDDSQTGAEQFRCMKIVFKNSTEVPTTDAGWYGTRSKVNDFLSKYPIEMLLHRINPDTLTAISSGYKKKIKLPYFGPGTTYTLERYNAISGNTVKANIKISVDLKYNFKVAYKIIEGYAPSIKSNECYVVRPDQNGYLVEVKGNSRLYWETVDGTYSNFTETIKLLGDKVIGGYLYKLRQTTSSGKINETAFIIPKMLAWYAEGYSGSSLPLQENLTANPMYWDILYWDNSAGRYKIEKRTEYYFANTAYGEVEFVPYSYSNYGLNQGDAWEFLAFGHPNYDITQKKTGRIYSNYANTSFMYNEDVDLQYGVVFPVINNTSFGDSNGYNVYDGNGIGFRASNCKTLDALDAYLRSRPLHVITGAYYYNAARSMPFPVVDTNINKRIPIKISDKDAITGTTYTVSNDGLSAKIKIAIPVTYLDVEVPEPTYILNSGKPQEFTTGTQYVDTKLKLFETAKDFTVLLDYMHKTSKGTFVVDNGVVFHCRYEASKSPYNYCGLSIQAGSAPTTYMYGGQGTTNYHPGIIADSTGTGRLTMYDGSRYRYRIMIVYKAGIPYKIAQVNETGDILFEYAINENHKKTFTAHSRPLYLGCQIAATSTSRSNYFKGTINECKIWDGTALTDAQIMKVIGANPYPKTSYELFNTVANTNNKIHTGVELFEVARDFTMCISFTPSYDTYNEDKAVLSCGVFDKNIYRLSIMYDEDLGGYTLTGCGPNQNILGTDTLIPQSATGKIALFIIYKNGEPSKIIDYSSGEYKSLTIASGLTAYSVPSISLPLTIGYQQFSTNDTAANHDVCKVWDGTIHDCIIWKDKILTDGEIDYLIKYGCN